MTQGDSNNIRQQQQPLHNQYYTNASDCRACGGRCCTNSAGLYVPDDFKDWEGVPKGRGTRKTNFITKALVMSLLKGGNIAIDWWDGDPTPGGNLPQVYYLRPRHQGEPSIHPSWGGTCINWSLASMSHPTKPKRQTA